MPPRKRAAAGQGELPGISSTKEIQDILWKAADKLRGSMDAAAYKEFVLGLVFLKYVSDAFAERRGAIAGAFLDDRDEYASANVFWVPEIARWDYLVENAPSGVGALLDEAMDAIMR